VDVDLSSVREDFDSNAFATHVEGEVPVTARDSESIKVYQPGVEAVWNTTSQLREAVELVIQEAWQESLLPRVEEEVNGEVDLGPPLDAPPSTGGHRRMELYFLSYLEGLAVAWSRFYKQDSRSSATSMWMWMRRLDRWPSDIHGD
jgi:hypothetical protein